MTKKEKLQKLKCLLQQSDSVSSKLMLIFDRSPTYMCSEELNVNEILPIWKNRASWNKSDKNSNAGKFEGLDELAGELLQNVDQTIYSHSIGSGVEQWMIFTDTTFSKVIGIVHNLAE